MVGVLGLERSVVECESLECPCVDVLVTSFEGSTGGRL